MPDIFLFNTYEAQFLCVLSETNVSNLEPRIVHIDTLPAMTGVSRFCEKGPPWRYSKEEHISNDALALQNFTYLLK
jgi:hypothetical protein